MNAAILVAIPLGLALLLAALPVVLVPTALAAKRPADVARAFLGGWLLALLIVGTLIIALVDVLVLPTGNGAWFGYAKILLGLLLVVLGARQWAGRPRGEVDPPVPGWMAGIESMTAGRAFGMALLLGAANPKNLVLTVSGATAIAEASGVPLHQAVALLVFVLIGSLGVAAPVVLTIALGDRADRVLAAADGWMTRQSTAIVAAVLLVLGVVLAINGLATL